MVECEECGKKLGILEGYQHPTLGRKHLVCSPCFEQVEESVAKWREFILSYSYNDNKPKQDFELKGKKIGLNFKQKRSVVENINIISSILLRK